MKPVGSGYADVNGIRLYHEIYGQGEPLYTQLSKSRLAIVPGYSHYNFITSPEVPQIIGKFLADPLTNMPAGAAAASQAAPAPKQTQQTAFRAPVSPRRPVLT